MKKIFLLTLLVSSYSLSFAIKPDDLEGIWFRTYGVFRPWADNNQGTFSYYEETMIFYTNGLVYIYDGVTKDLKGKSLFKLIKRNKMDFIVFYEPNQNPRDDMVQTKQGFYINYVNDSKDLDTLYLATEKEAMKFAKKKRSQKKFAGVKYQRVPAIKSSTKFIIPNSETPIF